MHVSADTPDARQSTYGLRGVTDDMFGHKQTGWKRCQNRPQCSIFLLGAEFKSLRYIEVVCE